MIDTAGPKAPAAESRPSLLDRRSLTRAAVIAVLSASWARLSSHPARSLVAVTRPSNRYQVD